MVKGKTKGSAKSVKYTPRVCPHFNMLTFLGQLTRKSLDQIRRKLREKLGLILHQGDL